MGHKNSKVLPFNIEGGEYSSCLFCDTKIHYSCQEYYSINNINKNLCIYCHNMVSNSNTRNNYFRDLKGG